MSKALRSMINVFVGMNALLLLGVVPANAQKTGNNAISKDSVGTIGASSAYIDAAPFYNAGSSDICQVLNNILNCTPTSCTTGYVPYPSAGAVVDARGILPSNPPNPLPCSVNPFSSVSVPSTILLPGTNIQISTTWTLPTNTRIIGEGVGASNYTVLEIASSFTGKAMIQMGTASGDVGVGIEHLGLNAAVQGQSSPPVTDGIDNLYAGNGSYVNDVLITNIGSNTTYTSINGTACDPGSGTHAVTGLCIGPNATDSGPYTNLNITPPNPCTSSHSKSVMCLQTACVKIQSQTRGIHGMTCTGSSDQDTTYWPLAAIYLDSFNNTIENVHVEGFQDAVVVADKADGQGNTIFGSISADTIANITSGIGANSGYVTNTVHICKANTASGACSANSFSANNITVLQALSSALQTSYNAHTIQDDITSTTLNSTPNAAFVGVYTLGGEPNIQNPVGYSRFTTSPSSSTPKWAAGSGIASGNCTNGAVYSNTAGTLGNKNTIYVCTGTWTGIGQ